MSYDPAGWSQPSERDIRHGRHRARHADAAPDPYVDGTGEDDTADESRGYGPGPADDPYHPGPRRADDPYRYGDGLSSQPLYAPEPARPRDDRLSRWSEPPTDPGRPRPAAGRWSGPPTAPAWSEPSTDPDWSEPASDRGRSDRDGFAPNRSPEAYRSMPAAPADPAGWHDEGTAPLDQLGPTAPANPAAAESSPATPPSEPTKPRRRSRAERRGDGEPKKSRAGRNLPAAIGVGLSLGAVVLTALFVWRPAFLGVVVIAACVATWELARAMAGQGRARPPLVPLLGGCVALTGLAWFAGLEALLPGLAFAVLAMLLWRLPDGPAGFHRDTTAAILISVYVPFLAGFAVLLVRPDDGALRMLVMLAAVVLSDTGGYTAGVFFGRHPMAPRVSPKKSWEGLVGSLVATGIGGALLLYYLFDVPWWHGAIFGLAVSAAAVLGDLAESLLKRDLGIKDMSSLLPGHGGLMDRLDSILFAAPVAYLLLTLLAPVGG